MNKTFSLIALSAILVCSLFGQATMTRTTLSVALTATDSSLTVASATGISASATNQEVVTELVIDKEALGVRTLSGLLVGVRRGLDGTRPTAHASGATVWVGPPNYFSSYDPSGGCTSTDEVALPKVVTPTGNKWGCSAAGLWEQFPEQNLGVPATGVTAVESGNSRKHVTEIQFTGITVGAPTTSANLAIGKLLYTLPAGAVVVKSAYISVGLYGSGTTCDADTPDVGLGYLIGSGAQAVLSGVGATAENYLTGQTASNLTGTATVKTVSDQIVSVEAATAHTVYLNVADGWAGACTVTATGTVVLEWAFLK